VHTHAGSVAAPHGAVQRGGGGRGVEAVKNLILLMSMAYCVKFGSFVKQSERAHRHRSYSVILALGVHKQTLKSLTITVINYPAKFNSAAS